MKFIDCFRFMSTSLSNVPDNVSKKNYLKKVLSESTCCFELENAKEIFFYAFIYYQL